MAPHTHTAFICHYFSFFTRLLRHVTHVGHVLFKKSLFLFLFMHCRYAWTPGWKLTCWLKCQGVKQCALRGQFIFSSFYLVHFWSCPALILLLLANMIITNQHYSYTFFLSSPQAQAQFSKLTSTYTLTIWITRIWPPQITTETIFCMFWSWHNTHSLLYSSAGGRSCQLCGNRQ